MFAKITCPACTHKYSVPESVMGKHQTCPKCNSLFVAGRSVAEPQPAAPGTPGAPAAAAAMAPASKSAPPAGGYNKTMLVDSSEQIRFNCPRCGKPQVASGIEGGTKKPCADCGQRLQVPPPPAAAAPRGRGTLDRPPGISKTMLGRYARASIRYNCPACKQAARIARHRSGDQEAVARHADSAFRCRWPPR